MPLVRGSSSRAAGCSLARIRRPRRRIMISRSRCSTSVTLPRFTTSSSSMRDERNRRTRSRRSSSRRAARPGARTTTTMPRRIRTATRAPRIGRVVSSTSALWSPGRARRGTVDEIVSEAFVPGGSASRRGRTVSQDAIAPPVRLRGTILGRPRRSSAKAARLTSTSTRRLPEFMTRIVARPEPASVTRAGEATSETGGRGALAPTLAGASTSTTGATASPTEASLIARSP